MITAQNLKSLHAAKRVAREPYAWPGGYPLFLVLSDGGALCKACCKKEYRLICSAAISDANDGWKPAAADINWESADLFCDNCSKQIESAYADDTATQEPQS